MNMKALLSVSILFISFSCWAQKQIPMAMATHLKGYLAKIVTKDSTYNGLFFKIDSQKVVVYTDDQYKEVYTADIKSIKLRVVKPGYEIKSYIFSSTKGKEYNQINQNGERVDEWGSKAPSIGDEVTGVVFGVIGEGIANVVAGTLHNINPHIASFKAKNGLNADQLASLSYYSIYYQQHPDILAEGRRLKAIAANFKP